MQVFFYNKSNSSLNLLKYTSKVAAKIIIHQYKLVECRSYLFPTTGYKCASIDL